MKWFRSFAALALAVFALSGKSPALALSADGIAASVPQFESVATYVGPAPATQKVHLVVFLAYPNQAAVDSFAQTVNNPDSTSYGAFMTPDQFAATFAPSPSTYSTVEYLIAGAGIQVVQTYANRKVIDAVATVAQADAVFHTIISQYRYRNVTYYANSVPALVPSALKGIVMAVSGFNNFAQHFAQPPQVNNPLTTPLGYGPRDIETAYNEPIHAGGWTGSGVTIAIETAYDYLDNDASGYWSAFGVKRTGYLVRKFVDDPVPQGLPLPGQSDETTLDMEQTTSNAPGANVIVYEGVDPLNSTFDDMYEQTVIDPRVDVVTTSWGSCEAGSDPNEVAADNDLFEQGAAEGQTRFAAAGDNGSRDCGTNNPPDGLPGQPNPITVDFPSSSPWVGAAGGTTLVLNANRSIRSESAWSGGGGGFSQFFGLPRYQSIVQTLASTKWRNTPDVALDADPNTPYALFYLGSWGLAVGGTSCVAPGLAAMYAQIDQYWGHRLGLSQTGLYNGFRTRTYPGVAWHDIVSGSNGDYNAHPGYDNATGVGSLNGYRYMLQIPRTRSALPLFVRRAPWHR
ncbi:MAG: S8/S53 family peptidase [Candidatus Eremiobacteraeota bacterium]|nr:S8/S53 family peptidase [Candidatus Eremiobacteraeota bacterium]MBV8262765.1 S8/S53 family peptidase [Candidatus Eremiobacteraeota bacterium]